MSLKKAVTSFRNYYKILKLNYFIYKLSKRKNSIFKELGLLVYEFYHVDKSLVEDEEVLSLISELKDIEIEIETIENKIEKIRNPSIKENEEISNELLLNPLKKEDTTNKEEKQ
jgi:hypothetical protein